MVVIDSYEVSNTTLDLKTTHPSAVAQFSACGQTFRPTQNYTLTSIKFWLRKTGSPIGNAVACLYAHSGTFGSSGQPTGAALATSDVLDVSTLTTTLQYIELLFSGGQQYSLVANTPYCIVFQAPGSGTIDTDNYPQVGYQANTGTHEGNWVRHYSGNWGYSSDHDTRFIVYGDGGELPKIVLLIKGA